MHPSEDNVEIHPENEFCESKHMHIFVGSIYAYKGLLMVSINEKRFLAPSILLLIISFDYLGFRLLSSLGNA